MDRDDTDYAKVPWTLTRTDKDSDRQLKEETEQSHLSPECQASPLPGDPIWKLCGYILL